MQHADVVDFEGSLRNPSGRSPHCVFPFLSEARGVASHMKAVFVGCWFFVQSSVSSQYSKWSEVEWCVSSIEAVPIGFHVCMYLSVLTAIMLALVDSSGTLPMHVGPRSPG